jgi:hypothetical protein
MQLKNKIKLINENYKNKSNETILRQYELFAQSSEQISLKRMSTNKFYLGVSTTIFAIASYLTILKDSLIIVLLSSIGIFLCLSWINAIESYKKLNAAKFKIIHELETYLPANLFKKEDEYLNCYYNLTNLEKFIPVSFIFLYGIILVFFLPTLLIELIKNLIGGF